MSQTQERRPLAVDLLENDDAYLAIFDAPGARKGDVHVRFEDNTIFVEVDRFREFHEGFEMVFPGRGLALDGRAELPEDAVVDLERATATLEENGTLHVRIPKADEQPESVDGDGDSTGQRAESDGEDVDVEDADSGDET